MNAWVNLAIIVGLFVGAWACRRIGNRMISRDPTAGDRPLCGACRFDLSGTLVIDRQGDSKPEKLGGICPECGADVSQPDAVVKAGDGFVVEALRMQLPPLLVLAGMLLILVFQPHQANYARGLPTSVLLWQFRNNLATANAEHSLVYRIHRQIGFPDARLRELVPEALTVARQGKLTGSAVWSVALSKAAERQLLSESELSAFLVGSIRPSIHDKPRPLLVTDRDRAVFTPRNTMMMWCPTTVKMADRTVLVARIVDEKGGGYALLPPRSAAGTTSHLDVTWRASLWQPNAVLDNPSAFDAPVASVPIAALRHPRQERPFVDRTCDPKNPAVAVLKLHTTDVIDQAGAASRQVVGMHLGIGTGGFGGMGRAECKAGGALQMSLVDENDTRYPLAIAVLLLPEDEEPALVDRFPRIYWALKELPPKASALLRPGYRVKLRIESSEELERTYLPGGPVWRGVSEYEVDVEGFGPANPDLWLSTF